MLVHCKGRKEGEQILFLQPRNREQETWTGRRLGVERAPAALAVDEAHPIEALDELLPKLLRGRDPLWFRTGVRPDLEARILAMVQTLIGDMIYREQVIDDWAHIKAPTLAFGGDQDMLAGTPAVFQQRMKYIVETIPNGKGKLLLLPGLGHVPHMEAPERTLPPLVAFLREGI